MTTTIDATLYSAGIAIVFASVYALKFVRIENFLRNLKSLRNWLGGGNGKVDLQHLDEFPVKVLAESPTAKIESSWWTDEIQFQLERRAIFSKTWMYVTHASRFQNVGDYRTFEIAGFSFIVILGKDKQLRAFHNVCRHRAYAVTKKESGSSTVLGCRYHGWSYDIRGKLIKAPEFENVAGFDKAMNGLWELKTEVRQGMVFVNFEVGGDEAALGLGKPDKVLESWKTGEMKWAHEWKVEGGFNWKLAEKLSSQTLKKHTASYWDSMVPAKFRDQESGAILSHTAFVRRLPSGRLLTMRLLPISTNKTLVECNIYGKHSRHTKATQIELDAMKKEVQTTMQQVELEQKDFMNGFREFQGSSLQDELKRLLGAHSDAEKMLGREIHPAARKQSFTPEGIVDDDLCKELEMGSDEQNVACGANTKGLLDW